MTIRTSLAALGTALALAGSLLATSPALAAGTFTITGPTSAAPGSTVTVTGTGCNGGSTTNVLWLDVNAADGSTVTAGSASPAEDGSWSVTVADLPTTPQTLSLEARCLQYDGPSSEEAYASASLTITSSATPTASPSVTPTPSASATASDGIALSVSTTSPSGQVTVTGEGFTPGEDVEVWLHSDPVKLATATADSAGKVSATITIPAGTALGQHSIELRGLTSGLTLSAPLTVTETGATTTAAATSAKPASTGTASLARTGVTAGLGLVALGAVAAGALLLARRRRA